MADTSITEKLQPLAAKGAALLLSDCEPLTVDELRTLARMRGSRGVQVASMNRAALLALLTGAPLPIEQLPTGAPPVSAGNADLNAALAALQAALAPKLDMAAIRDEIAKAVAEMTLPKPLTIQVRELPPVEIKTPHKQFETLLRVLTCGIRNVWLVGTAGAGKTHASEDCAKAMGLPYGSISVCQQSTKADLLGFTDATGTYRSTHFRRIYEHGGVFLLDEIDNGNPNVLAVLNQALSNNQCAFADSDAMVPRHKDCYVLAGANTVGHGATAKYVGRNPIDAATIDRFVFIQWEVDEALEVALCGNKAWATRVQKVRKVAGELGLSVVVSPRASINGAKLLAGGFLQSDVESMVLFKDWSGDAKAKVLAKLA